MIASLSSIVSAEGEPKKSARFCDGRRAQRSMSFRWLPFFSRVGEHVSKELPLSSSASSTTGCPAGVVSFFHVVQRRAVEGFALTDALVGAGFSLHTRRGETSNVDSGRSLFRTFTVGRVLPGCVQKLFVFRTRTDYGPRANCLVSQNNTHDVEMMAVSENVHALS